METATPSKKRTEKHPVRRLVKHLVTPSGRSSRGAWVPCWWLALSERAAPLNPSVFRSSGTAIPTTPRQPPQRPRYTQERGRWPEARPAYLTPFRSVCSKGAERTRRAQIARATTDIPGRENPISLIPPAHRREYGEGPGESPGDAAGHAEQRQRQGSRRRDPHEVPSLFLGWFTERSLKDHSNVAATIR